jgi:stage V sporulation protein S
MTERIRVSSYSPSKAVAGAIAGVMREAGYAELQVIGANAINQAIKAVTIARGYLRQDDIDLMMTTDFVMVEIDGDERTAVRVSIFKCPIGEKRSSVSIDIIAPFLDNAAIHTATLAGQMSKRGKQGCGRLAPVKVGVSFRRAERDAAGRWQAFHGGLQHFADVGLEQGRIQRSAEKPCGRRRHLAKVQQGEGRAMRQW